MNYLGIDWGKAKIGIALGNDEMKIASPILIFSYHDIQEVLKKLRELIGEENVEKIVVGIPISLSGGLNVSKKINSFIAKLNQLGPEIILEDERLSTKLAQSLKKQFQCGHKVGDDDIAAAAILQNYFDKL